ncbi:hypothetical protein [Massilia luteola]|uniref:hypothetical protein n=1 Tax=Massilia luteola TaxID=3081751 RepID=UPI002ACC27BA|nr:hypothetical protein [Massilia sp. Gc5]
MNIKAEMTDSPSPDRLDRRHAQARHDRWALEMDRALFSAAPAAPVRQPGLYAWQSPSESPTAPRAIAQDPMRHMASDRSGAARAQDDDREPSLQPDGSGVVMGAPNVARGTVAGVVDASAGDAPASFAAGPAAAAGPTSAVPSALQSSAMPQVTGAAGQPASAAGTVPPAIASVPQAGIGGVTAAPGGPLPGMGGPGAVPLQAPIVADSANTVERSETFAMPQATSRTQGPAAGGGVALFAPLPDGSTSQAEVSHEEEEPTGARPGSEVGVESGEEYAQRLLHLYEHNGDVQAWIRDAQLQPTQARAVAQALAMQLSVQGTRLATLTINGREVELSTEPGQSHPVADLFDQRLTDAAAASSPDQGDSPA